MLNKELKITVYTNDGISKSKLFLKMRQQNDSQSSHIIRYRINFRNYGIKNNTKLERYNAII